MTVAGIAADVLADWWGDALWHVAAPAGDRWSRFIYLDKNWMEAIKVTETISVKDSLTETISVTFRIAVAVLPAARSVVR
jgi:hypothetical protein